MKRVIKTLLTLLLSASVFAATPLTFTGLVQSTSGALATSGYVEFDITPQNQGIAFAIVGTTLIASQTGRCGINNVGQVLNSTLSGPCLIWGNDVISPGNSLYKIIVAPNGKPANTFNNVLLSGTTVDLSNLTFISPTPVVGQQVNFDPLITQNISPGINGVFTVGQFGKRYATVYTNSITGNDVATPQTPSTGEIGYFKANSGWCSLDSNGVERCIGAPPTPISCSTSGAVVIQSPSGSVFICDSSIISDGAGGLSVQSLNAIGNVVAGGSITATGAVQGSSVGTNGAGGVLELRAQSPPTPGAGAFDTFIDIGTGLLGCRNSSSGNCLGAAQLISSGTTALPTSAITSGGCSSTGAVTATGVVSTDTITASPNVDPTGLAGYGPSASGSLYVQAFPATNTVTFKVCNNTAGTITPAALTLNWRVAR